ncbi:hypothetical protein D3C77_625880 [compost metagenome]
MTDPLAGAHYLYTPRRQILLISEIIFMAQRTGYYICDNLKIMVRMRGQSLTRLNNVVI